MSRTYDVFRKGPDGFEWIETVEGLENARARVKHMTRSDPAHTYVYDQRNSTVVRQTNPDGGTTLF